MLANGLLELFKDRPWGFIAFQTVYFADADEKVSKAVSRIYEFLFNSVDTVESIDMVRLQLGKEWGDLSEEAKATRIEKIRASYKTIKDLFVVVVKSDPKFEGAKIAEISEEFRAWRKFVRKFSNVEPDPVPPISQPKDCEPDSKPNCINDNFCLLLDEESVNSILRAPNPTKVDAFTLFNGLENTVKIVDVGRYDEHVPLDRGHNPGYAGWFLCKVNCLFNLYQDANGCVDNYEIAPRYDFEQKKRPAYGQQGW